MTSQVQSISPKCRPIFHSFTLYKKSNWILSTAKHELIGTLPLKDLPFPAVSAVESKRFHHKDEGPEVRGRRTGRRLIISGSSIAFILLLQWTLVHEKRIPSNLIPSWYAMQNDPTPWETSLYSIRCDLRDIELSFSLPHRNSQSSSFHPVSVSFPTLLSPKLTVDIGHMIHILLLF